MMFDFFKRGECHFKYKTRKTCCVFVSLLFFWSQFVQSQVLKVATGWKRPPYIISESQSGLEIDLIREIMRRLGHDIEILSFSQAETIENLRAGAVDIALTLNANSDIATNRLSDIYIIYQNVVVSLKSKHLQINHVDELKNYVVIGFQGASTLLGPEFTNAIKDNSQYSEIADQKQQIEYLFQGRADAITIDLNVFRYLSKELSHQSTNPLREITVHPLFTLNRFSAGFKDISLKESFNRELGLMVASGEYDRLLKRYDYHIIDPQHYQ